MMTSEFKIGVVILCIIFFNTTLMAQTKEWKNEKTKDGKISAKYNISTRADDDGEEVPLIESVTTISEKISIDKCVALMKNVSKHKDFHGDDMSKTIKSLSDNKWIIYYYTEGNMFTPDADGVYTMTATEDPSGKTAMFTITAAPTLLEKKDVKRVTYLTEAFNFKDLGNGTTQITMTSNMSPAFQVPAWILKMSFPDALYDVIQKFVKLAHNE
jgi:hypothetical protein